MFDASASIVFVTVVLAILLLIIWRSGVGKYKRLGGEVDELSAELAATRQALLKNIDELAAEVKELRAKAIPAQVGTTAQPAPVSRLEAGVVSPAMTAPLSAPSVPKGVATPEEFVSAPPPPQAERPVEANFAIGQTREPSPTIFERLRSLLNFEEMLGSNWFAKLGAGILVLGIAFFLAWQLREVGPMGKVTVGWLVGAVMLGAGIFVERKERYRMVARAGVGAGWAMWFFTSYAMNHVAAAHVLDSTLADLALMFLVAAGMVLHTLHYRSQVLTGLAFLCAYLAIAFNRADVGSLTAAVVLAVGVVWVVLRMEWFVLEICAIIATFLNHFLWLRPIIAPMGKHHHHFPEFYSSAAILASYWAVFRFSYLWRRGGDQERISTLAALVNTGLLLAVLKYQSVDPKMAFWGLLVLGSVELGLGQLSRARARTLPHIVLTVIGACMLVAAIPFHFGPADLHAQEYIALAWLAEAEAFFLVGVLTREQVFRRVGLGAFVPLMVQLIGVETASIYGRRMDGADFKGEFFPALICILAALVLYWNVHRAPRRWAEQFTPVVEQLATRDLSYAAGAVALAAAWMAFPWFGTAVAWMALSCTLAWLASRFEFQPMRVQSIAMAAFVFIRVLVVNLPDTTAYHFAGRTWSARLLTTALAVALCYVASHWHRSTDTAWLRWLEPGFTWVASTILTLLMWYELKTASVALGWAVFALLILEAGFWRQSANLRLQAYVAGISVFLRLLFVNLNAVSPVAGARWSPRLYTVVPLVLFFYYVYRRLDESAAALHDLDRKFKAAQTFAWLGTLSVILLLRFEVALDWIATAWAAAVLVLMALAWKTNRPVFLHQALFLSLGVLFRGVMHNLYERSYFTPPSKLLSGLNVISAAGFLFAALVFAFKLRQTSLQEGKSRMRRALQLLAARPEQLLFFVPLGLITAYLAVELRSGLVTMAWALEAVVVFLFALWIGERSYRLSAVGLLMLCVGKIIVVDIWRLGIRDRAITFIVLGAMLLGVSILYSRNREKVRQFL
ncbi:MAG: DUF2339 domain-containing protein [Acidobacteriia bacterium]|nr:DUF2339 domain-containing protein [Terriglobia bacterium]